MAKIDELHNYAYPDKYLDELHIYDKSKGVSDFDEVHNYGNRGVTYGMDELHLYGSYQTVEEDEVNKPSQKYEVIDIDEYFDEIEVLDEQQKEERKELANEFKDIMSLIFALMLADLRVGNELNEGFYHSLAKSRLMDAVDRKMPYLTADIYVEIENYINQNLNYVIETTINRSGEPYTFSEARATSLAVDDALASFNIEELNEAIKAGYKYKIWKAMDDNKVRLTHQKVDGKKVEIRKPFEVGRCLMQAPMVFDEYSPFQDAKEVVNCRCQLIYSNNKDSKDNNGKSYNKANDKVNKGEVTSFDIPKLVDPIDADIFDETTAQYRKKNNNPIINEVGGKGISKPIYHKLTRKAIKDGADIRIATSQNENKKIFQRLLNQKASAVTYSDVIFFLEHPTISDVLEEVYHFYQALNNVNSEYTDLEERRLRNEIDAQHYLLSVTDKYKIPIEEVETTKFNLQNYEKDLEELLKKW